MGGAIMIADSQVVPSCVVLATGINMNIICMGDLVCGVCGGPAVLGLRRHRRAELDRVSDIIPGFGTGDLYLHDLGAIAGTCIFLTMTEGDQQEQGSRPPGWIKVFHGLDLLGA
jgi:hypothetical protein